MTDTKELAASAKKCPLCGKQPSLHDYEEHEDQTGEVEGYAFVQCCYVFIDGETLEDALKIWNTRHD